MRESIISLIFLLLIFSGFPAFAGNDSTQNFNDPAKPIMVGKTESVFTINLKSNPTTGFSWFLVGYDRNLIQPVGHKYYAPDVKLIGAGGYEKWSFKVKPAGFIVPQVTNIHLAYTRPWSLEDYKPVTFKVVTHDS